MKTFLNRIAIVSLGLPGLFAGDLPLPKKPDVVVAGATPGGIAAAVSAARLGERVLLIDHYDHIGGIISNGLTNADIGRKQAVGGLFYEFTRRVVKHYQAAGNAEDIKRCRDGYWYEPQVAERIFHEMITEQEGRIELLLGHRLLKAQVDGGRLASVEAQRVDGGGEPVRIEAGVFIDATYEGDLAALAGAPFRVGRESRVEYGETHAGKVYARFGTGDLLPGSTGEGDDGIQGFCFRFHMTTNPGNMAPVEKPAAYDREDYRHLLSDIREGRITRLNQAIQFYPMPGDRFEVNSDHPHPDTGVPSESLDLAEENWAWPEAGLKQRKKIYQRYLSYDVGLLWFLQNDPEVPSAIREEAARYGWCRDLWPENHHLPLQVYVRQGRRILGGHVFTQRDGELDSELQRTAVRTDSIAVAEFAFDSHGVHKFDPAHPGVREGYIYITHPPIQVPYGVIVPRQPGALLAPVACSASHVGYNAIRMEPVFMALGEAAGIAAHLSIRGGVPVASVPVDRLQRQLVERGGVITYYGDLPFDHPAFAAMQWLGARALNPGYEATPERPLTRRDGWVKLERIMRATGREWTAPDEEPDAPLLGRDLAEWLRQARLRGEPAGADGLKEKKLNLEEFARLVYDAFPAPSE